MTASGPLGVLSYTYGLVVVNRPFVNTAAYLFLATLLTRSIKAFNLFKQLPMYAYVLCEAFW